MTSSGKTVPKPAPSRDGGGFPRPPSRRLARQRRPAWIAAGVMLMALAVLANVFLFQSSSHRVPVVRLARDVPVGQPIVQADLAVARVAVDSAVETIPGRQLNQVVGRRASVGLRKGTLVAASQLTAQLSPAPGHALVTVPLKASGVPEGLAPGWQVRVVVTPGAQSQSTGSGASQGAGETTALRDIAGVVDQVSDPDAEGTVRVSLQVVNADSSTVARQSAAGLVALVVTARRG